MTSERTAAPIKQVTIGTFATTPMATPVSVSRRAGEQNSRLRSDATSPGTLIALIEDDNDIRDPLAELLVENGYRVMAFVSAEQALRDLRQGPAPQLILLDLMMPGMNGWQFRVEQMRSPELASIPTIALSADTSAYAVAINTDAYVKKPVSFDRLQVVIEQVLLASERRRIAAKAVELERMASLNMLIAGVAHEINNPLTYVIGNLEASLLRLHKAGAPLPQNALADGMEAALEGAQRIASVVRLLSSFTRGETREAHDTDVLHALDAASRLAMQQIRSRARLRCDLAPLPPVNAREGHLAQIFLNLLLNAADAIEPGEPEKHEIRVVTRVQNDKVIIEITDDGRGIAPDMIARIFEPFYSTKPLESGTGVGLSVTRDLVTDLGGAISAKSELGRGSTFRVELPLSVPRMEDVVRDTVLSGEPPRCRILIIDDEAAIGQLLTLCLDRHHVEAVTSPKEGIVRLADGSFDIVLCDLTMPDMSGIQVYDSLCRSRPDLKSSFILMTGAAIYGDVEDFVSQHPVKVLRKPFAIEELEAYVAQIAAKSALATMPRS